MSFTFDQWALARKRPVSPTPEDGKRRKLASSNTVNGQEASSATTANTSAGSQDVQADTFAKLQSVELSLSLAQPKFTIVPPSFSVESTFSKPENAGTAIKRPSGLDLLYIKSFLVAPGRKNLFRYLLEALPWYKVTYQARGKHISTPRYTTVFGKDSSMVPGSSYYRAPRPIPPALRVLKEEVEQRVGAQFNFVLVNFYKDGNDSITYHSDDEGFLGPDPTIASLTLGGTRDFLMRPKDSAADKPQKWLLSSGDMVVMRGTTQRLWEHAIPKRASAEGRINITFRKAIMSRGTNNYYRYNVGDGPVFRWKNGQMVEESSSNAAISSDASVP